MAEKLPTYQSAYRKILFLLQRLADIKQKNKARTKKIDLFVDNML